MSNVFFGETGPIRDPALTAAEKSLRANSGANETPSTAGFAASNIRNTGFSEAVDARSEATRPRTLSSTSA